MISEQNKKIAIIGGGIAGMQAATILGRFGYAVTLYEKHEQLGGNVGSWSYLFPHNEKASDVLSELKAMLKTLPNIAIRTKVTVENISIDANTTTLSFANDPSETFDAVVVASGFEPFDASRKEEYGYGVFDNVITSVDFEYAEKNETISKLLPPLGGKVGFVHCVGSRDEKVCNEYCSKACCITAIKQAIEVKKYNPSADVYCFYMDLRLFDRHFESIYRKAQEEYGIQFIRGRMSEVNEAQNKQLVVRVEDTLLRRPMKLELDLIVLMVGMEPSKDTQRFAQQLGHQSEEDRFISDDGKVLVAQNMSLKKLVFVAGTAKGPSTVRETLADAKSVALNVHFYLKNMHQ